MTASYNHSYIIVNNQSCLTQNKHGCNFNHMTYGQRLKQAREFAKLTQKELVERLGTKDDGKPLMSQANLAKLEQNPKAKGSIYTSIIATVCGVSADWLTNEVGEMLPDGYLVMRNTPEASVYLAMQQMEEPQKYNVVKISNSLAEPKANGTEGHK